MTNNQPFTPYIIGIGPGGLQIVYFFVKFVDIVF